jgi:hypothetical protein
MSFGVGLILYIAGTALVALCLMAIPGRGGAAPAQEHGGDHGHGH